MALPFCLVGIGIPDKTQGCKLFELSCMNATVNTTDAKTCIV